MEIAQSLPTTLRPLRLGELLDDRLLVRNGDAATMNSHEPQSWKNTVEIRDL